MDRLSFNPQLNSQRTMLVQNALHSSATHTGGLLWVDAGCNDGGMIRRILHSYSYSFDVPQAIIAIDVSWDQLSEAVGTNRHGYGPTTSATYFTSVPDGAEEGGDAASPFESPPGNGNLWPVCMNLYDRKMIQASLVATLQGDLTASSHPDGMFSKSIRSAVSQHLGTAQKVAERGGEGMHMVITSIEVLEHIHPLQVEAYTSTIFQQLPLHAYSNLLHNATGSTPPNIKVVLTTPNSNFNAVRSALINRAVGDTQWRCPVGGASDEYQRQYSSLRHNGHFFELTDEAFDCYVDYVRALMGCGCTCVGCTVPSPCGDGSRLGVRGSQLTRIYTLGSKVQLRGDDGEVEEGTIQRDRINHYIFNQSGVDDTSRLVACSHALEATLELVHIDAAHHNTHCTKPIFPFKAIFGVEASDAVPRRWFSQENTFGDKDTMTTWGCVGPYSGRWVVEDPPLPPPPLQPYRLHDVLWYPSAMNRSHQKAAAARESLPCVSAIDTFWETIMRFVLGEGVRWAEGTAKQDPSVVTVAEYSKSPLHIASSSSDSENGCEGCELDDWVDREPSPLLTSLVPFHCLMSAPAIEALWDQIPIKTILRCTNGVIHDEYQRGSAEPPSREGWACGGEGDMPSLLETALELRRRLVRHLPTSSIHNHILIVPGGYPRLSRVRYMCSADPHWRWWVGDGR